MYLLRLFFLASLSITLFLGTTQCLATSTIPAYSHRLSKKAVYHDNTGNIRYFLSSFASIQPWSLGTSPYGMAAMYNHAAALLQQHTNQNSQQSSFGFHINWLSMSFRTTTGVPIPWDAALHFMQIMMRSLRRGMIGPEFQAYVTDVVLDVTIEISLRLLLDGQLPNLNDDLDDDLG